MERLIKSAALQNVSDYHVMLIVGCSRSCFEVKLIQSYTYIGIYMYICKPAIKVNARSLRFFRLCQRIRSIVQADRFYTYIISIVYTI